MKGMNKKNPFARKVGRPPAPTSAFGSARPRRPTRGPMAGAGMGLSAMPGSTASPMDGASLGQPTAAFRTGGDVHGHKRMAHHHDDSAHRKGAHGHRNLKRGGAC